MRSAPDRDGAARRVKPLVRAASAVAASLGLAFAATAPAQAHGDAHTDETRAARIAAASTPALSARNATLIDSVPGKTGISGCFMPSAAIFVMSSLDSITVFDASDPRHPVQLGVLPNLVFENEAMNCGERKVGKSVERFALIGVDTYDVSADIDHTSEAAGGKQLIVVDVTDPTAPRLRSTAPATTSTHTVACVDSKDCRYAYSAGSRTAFSLMDLSDLDAPVEVDANPAVAGTQPHATPTGGHKWNFDDAGFATHTGYNGSAIFDVRDPLHPSLVTTTGAAGRGLATDGTRNGYNDFIHHNSSRPNASAFRPEAVPSFANGNVLLVTEEDYEDVNCATAGSFQTWWVKRLDGTPDAIVPLDKVELADLGSFPSPVGAFCSAHWFDWHPSGIVTVGYYGGGTQLVDARDPHNLTSWGHAVQGASEVWDSYFVPVYNGADRRTDRRTNIAWSVDLVRGLDVYEVTLPSSKQLVNGLVR